MPTNPYSSFDFNSWLARDDVDTIDEDGGFDFDEWMRQAEEEQRKREEEEERLAQEKAELNMKNKYWEIKDKEFSRLNPTNDIDFPIIIGTRLDEATGEKIPLTKTARELFEEEAATFMTGGTFNQQASAGFIEHFGYSQRIGYNKSKEVYQND